MSVAEIIQPSKEIIVIEPTQALTVFTTEGALDPILEKIRKEIDEFVPDVSTAKGRKEIASMAYRVAQSKTYLDGVGKRLADEQKEIPKKIDAARREVRETLDKWKDEVRKPLTEWEEAEERRVNIHKAAIRQIETAGDGVTSSAELWTALEKIEAIVISPELKEFEAVYARAKDAAVKRLFDAATSAEKREKEAAELERFRKAEAERLEAERLDRIRREVEAKAKAEADEKIKAEREAAERREREIKEAAEREKREADEKRRLAESEAARREAELRAQAAEAEKKAAEAEAKAKRDAEEARQREAEETARRESDKKIRAKIHRTIITDLVDGGLSEAVAKKVVDLVLEGKVPYLRISY